ncbi:eukaryotic translation initiation factor 4 gamma 1-like, partial [Carassius carassius]|uniref:eukaryotic translation initiation factor 4 gamma 1-like n=1 Tax=Carassius carassius TaxID=217509 RepID=UPI0028686B33
FVPGSVTNVLCPGGRTRGRTWRRTARLASPESEAHRETENEKRFCQKVLRLDADAPGEINKAPQPLSGPPSAPLPSPSPGLSQPSFAPPPLPPVVFSSPPPQMNPAAQPRQPYFPPQPTLPNSGRVQSSSAPRSIPPPHRARPPHVFQTGPSQMMMIPQQPISFPNSKGTAYYISGQYRPSYVTPQQYQVASSPGFYPGTSPADYAGAYCTTQPQFTPPVAPPTVIMNPAPQQQQAPPPQQEQQAPPRRERKQIRIRDPKQGGLDITEEIMFGGRSGFTPTPPQVMKSHLNTSTLTSVLMTYWIFCITENECLASHYLLPLASDQVTYNYFHKLTINLLFTHSKRTQPNGDNGTPAVAMTTRAEFPIPPGESPIPDTPPTPPPTSLICDMVDAPPPAPTDDSHTPPTVFEPPASNGAGTTPTNVTLPFPTLESPIVQPEELQLFNGLPVSSAHRDISPIAEPDVTKEAPPVTTDIPDRTVKEIHPQVVTESPVLVVKEVPAPVVKEPIPPVVMVTPAVVVKDTVAPFVRETPASVVTATVPVVSKETPKLVDVETLPQVTQETVVKEALVFTVIPVETTPVVKETTSLAAKEIPEPLFKESTASSKAVSKATPPPREEREDTPTTQTTPSDSTMQVVSVPKKKRKMKDLNKKEAGDLLDAFKEPTPPEPEATPQLKAEPESPAPVAPPPAEELEETWEEKEDKLDAENIKPESPTQSSPTIKKYHYKEEQWKPLDPEEKKKYDREFLLGFQFISASMNKPEGLPQISDVVLDKANKTPLRQLDPSRLSGMNCGPDFTPSFANLGRPSAGGRGPPSGLSGPRRSGQGQRGKEPRKIIASVSLTEDVQLNKAEKAWKPTVKRSGRAEEDEPEFLKTQELFKRVRSVLNKLTPQMFQPLMKQVTELSIDTEERLKGVIDLIFEKAISEPNFSVAYANMCRCLMGLKVPTSDKPGVTVNFRKLLLNRCQKEFEKDKDDDEIFEKKQKELDAATGEEKQRLKEELEDAKDKARRRSLGNIKFIGELFKLKMLTETIMHDCIVKLLKNHDEESLECLCRLLSTIGKDLDFQKAKPRMDQYFNQMEKIIKERKTSSRIRFMLQDVLDLRRNNWVPRRGDLGPKTIEQIHKEAELEEHREQVKVQQQLLSKKDSRSAGGGGGMGPRGGPHTPGPRSNQAPDDGWNTVPISTKNRPIDPTRLSKITKPGALDFSNQLLVPGGKGSWGSWGKGSSGGSGAKASDSTQDSGRTSTLNRFSALQQPASSSSSSSSNVDSDRRLPHRSSFSRERSDRFDRVADRYDRRDDRGSDRMKRPAVGQRSFSREKEERNREREHRPAEMLQRVSSERERERGTVNLGESVPNPPPVSSKPALTEEEMEKKSTAIIEEYLHLNDMKEALQCIGELSCSSLSVFVRTGVESTLERSTIAREHMGSLFHQLLKTHTLSTQQYYKGLLEVLELAEDMEIDIPHVWLYLAELITPMMHLGGIPMGPLFRELSKPLLPLGKAGVLLVEILKLLCKAMSHKKVGAMWRDAALRWKDFLPQDQDANKFVTEEGVEFTLGEECVRKSSKVTLSPEDISRELERLLQEKADNQRIFDWVEANLDEQQTSSNTFIWLLITAVCQSAIICENPYKVDTKEMTQRAKLLQRYIKDEQKELQALYALQSLMVQMEQPPNLLRMFFDVLYDEDVIKEDGFYRWESSKDPAEQQGKGVALKSVTAFFTWLREAEDESDNS